MGTTKLSWAMLAITWVLIGVPLAAVLSLLTGVDWLINQVAMLRWSKRSTHDTA